MNLSNIKETWPKKWAFEFNLCNEKNVTLVVLVCLSSWCVSAPSTRRRGGSSSPLGTHAHVTNTWTKHVVKKHIQKRNFCSDQFFLSQHRQLHLRRYLQSQTKQQISNTGILALCLLYPCISQVLLSNCSTKFKSFRSYCQIAVPNLKARQS
jgi:hypothetical protein